MKKSRVILKIQDRIKRNFPDSSDDDEARKIKGLAAILFEASSPNLHT